MKRLHSGKRCAASSPRIVSANSMNMRRSCAPLRRLCAMHEMLDDLPEAIITALGVGIFIAGTFALFMVLA